MVSSCCTSPTLGDLINSPNGLFLIRSLKSRKNNDRSAVMSFLAVAGEVPSKAKENSLMPKSYLLAAPCMLPRYCESSSFMLLGKSNSISSSRPFLVVLTRNNLI